jgi:hypothetical protein
MRDDGPPAGNEPREPARWIERATVDAASPHMQQPRPSGTLIPPAVSDLRAPRSSTREIPTWRRWSLTLATQSVASITNFAAGALALSSGDLAAFGRFSIAYQLGLVVVTAGEASTGAAALIQGSREVAESDGHAVSDGTSSAALVLGAAMALPIAVAGLLVGGSLGSMLLLTAVGAPGLVSQYTLRQLRFARQDQLGVLRADSIWLVVLVAVAAADRFTTWQASPTAYLAAWLAGATVSGAPLILVGVSRGLRQLHSFWNATGPHAIRLGVAGLLARSAFVVPLIATNFIVGTEASGALAAALLVFSPLSVVHSAAVSIVVPAKIGAAGVHVVDRRVPHQVVGGVSVITLAWAGGLLALDGSGLRAGPFALAANGITAALFTATLLRFLGLAFGRGALVGLLIANASTGILRTRVVGTLTLWVVAVLGLVVAGLDGGAYGIAIATWFGGAVMWQSYRSLHVR